MKFYKALSVLCLLISVILSDIMCAVVGYSYAQLKYDTASNSAPASTAFVYVIPFSVGILLFIALAIIFRKKTKH